MIDAAAKPESETYLQGSLKAGSTLTRPCDMVTCRSIHTPARLSAVCTEKSTLAGESTAISCHERNRMDSKI